MKFTELADRIAESLNHSFRRFLAYGGDQLIEDDDSDKKISYRLTLVSQDEIRVTVEFKKCTPELRIHDAQ